MAKVSQRLSAASRLALVRAKVERAKKNLIDMEAVLHEFHGGIPGRARYIKALKSKAGEIIRYDLPFDTLAAAGDIVNNLRSSLDHLVYQLADAFDPNCDPRVLETISFPIGEDLAEYKSLKRRIVKVIHPDAIKLIDDLKPYKSGDNPLWLLNKLNNISKHRMLLTVGEIVMCHADWVGEISVSTAFMYKVSDPHFVGIYAMPSVKDYVHIPGQKSIGNPKVMRGDAMLPTLHQLLDFVFALIPRFLCYLEPQ
jgi:hypothetical protein